MRRGELESVFRHAVKRAGVESSGRIGRWTDSLVLYCFNQYLEYLCELHGIPRDESGYPLDGNLPHQTEEQIERWIESWVDKNNNLF